MPWRCELCTIINYNDVFLACEMCGTPRAVDQKQPSLLNKTKGLLRVLSQPSSALTPKAVRKRRPNAPASAKNVKNVQIERNSRSLPPAPGAAFAGPSSREGECGLRDGATSNASTVVISDGGDLDHGASDASKLGLGLGFAVDRDNAEAVELGRGEVEETSKAELIDSVFGQPDETRRLLEELITSEQAYVDSLRILVTHFLQPLRTEEMAGNEILPVAEINLIFSNIQELMRINIELITSIEKQIGDENEQQEIEASKSSFDLTMAITAAFKEVIPYFKMYSVYVNNYPFAVERLKHCEESEPKFAAFLADASSHPVCKGLNLGAFLIMPVQRLCKYPLFFARLLKITDPMNMSYPLIQEAANVVNEITEKVDLDKDRAQKSLRGFELGNMIQTSGLSKRLNRVLHILEPGRHFIHEWEGMFCRGHSISPSKQKPRYMVLFSNLLVVCKKNKGYIARVWIKLEDMHIGDLQPMIQASSNGTGTPNPASSQPHAYVIKVVHQHLSSPQSSSRISDAIKSGLNRAKSRSGATSNSQPTKKDEYCFFLDSEEKLRSTHKLLVDTVEMWRADFRGRQPVELAPIASTRPARKSFSLPKRSAANTFALDLDTQGRPQSATLTRTGGSHKELNVFAAAFNASPTSSLSSTTDVSDMTSTNEFQGRARSFSSQAQLQTSRISARGPPPTPPPRKTKRQPSLINSPPNAVHSQPQHASASASTPGNGAFRPALPHVKTQSGAQFNTAPSTMKQNPKPQVQGRRKRPKAPTLPAKKPGDSGDLVEKWFGNS